MAPWSGIGHGHGGGALRDGAFIAVGLGQGGGSLDARRAARGNRLGHRRSGRRGSRTGTDLRAAAAMTTSPSRHRQLALSAPGDPRGSRPPARPRRAWPSSRRPHGGSSSLVRGSAGRGSVHVEPLSFLYLNSRGDVRGLPTLPDTMK